MSTNKVFKTAVARWGWVVGVVVFLVLLPMGPVKGQLPNGFSRQVVLTQQGITSMHYAPDGRLFFTRKNGKIRIFKNGQILKPPYATLGVSYESERGLLGFAFDPAFMTNCRIYVYYTTGPTSLNYNGKTAPRISRLHGCSDVSDGTEKIVRDFPHTAPAYKHNGGDLQFGSDGKLYIGIGDGGHSQLSQRLDSYAGKVLRLNINGTAPADNPFVGVPGALPEIWAYGFRNPWRMAFRISNNMLIAADVGAGNWEEIDAVSPGGNFAWNIYEGPCERNVPLPKEADCTPDPTTYPASFEYPILFYSHDVERAAVIGGVFVPGGNYPKAFQGRYFYGDFMLHSVRSVILDDNNQVVADEPFDVIPGGPTAFTTDPNGNVLVYDWATTTVFRYVFTP